MPFEIHVVLAGKTITLDVKVDTTIKDLKAKIREKEDIETVHLAWCGKQLELDNADLEYYGILSRPMLHLVQAAAATATSAAGAATSTAASSPQRDPEATVGTATATFHPATKKANSATAGPATKKAKFMKRSSAFTIEVRGRIRGGSRVVDLQYGAKVVDLLKLIEHDLLIGGGILLTQVVVRAGGAALAT